MMSRARDILSWPGADAASFAPLEEPIRAELFSVERLEQHAERLAAAQRVSLQSGDARRHTRRLNANTKALIATYRAIVSATRVHEPITPATEWLLDNFHVADEQIRENKDDLPPGFYVDVTGDLAALALIPLANDVASHHVQIILG